MISNCGHDENNRYKGGKAGDQTGQEWAIIPWYSRPWNVVLRYPNESVGKKIAELAEKAAKNNNIGYDQNERGTYWNCLRASGYDPSKIAELCEADCSSGAVANIKAVGYLLGIAKFQNLSTFLYTGNLRKALENAGFETLYDEKYLSSDEYLLPGDILLYEGHHVATNLTEGSKAYSTPKQEYPYWVHLGKDWYYRIANGTNQHGFKNINHHRYYFDSTGKMKKGWFEVDGYLYYGQQDGPLEGAIYTADSNGRQTLIYIP